MGQGKCEKCPSTDYCVCCEPLRTRHAFYTRCVRRCATRCRRRSHEPALRSLAGFQTPARVTSRKLRPRALLSDPVRRRPGSTPAGPLEHPCGRGRSGSAYVLHRQRPLWPTAVSTATAKLKSRQRAPQTLRAWQVNEPRVLAWVQARLSDARRLSALKVTTVGCGLSEVVSAPFTTCESARGGATGIGRKQASRLWPECGPSPRASRGRSRCWGGFVRALGGTGQGPR